jgi:hypothetical protein
MQTQLKKNEFFIAQDSYTRILKNFKLPQVPQILLN